MFQVLTCLSAEHDWRLVLLAGAVCHRLRSWPFDKIKIDKSFVQELATRSEAMAIIRAVTGLGRSLGISSTAEGVEASEQLAIVESEGCTEIQGYLVSPLRPSAGIAGILRNDEYAAVAWPLSASNCWFSNRSDAHKAAPFR